MSKEQVYLYSDGIYVGEKTNSFSYLKRAYEAPLSNITELRPYLEAGTPADHFSMGMLDQEDYQQYHKVPWYTIKQMLNVAYTVFQTYDQPHNDLHIFLFQKVNTDSQDKFKMIIPKQILNRNSLAMINDDATLQKFLHDDEWIFDGQFVFINGNKENDFDYSLNSSIDNKIALADIPQNLYLFNNISKQFNFRDCFAGMRILPSQFSIDNQSNFKALRPNDVNQYLQIPVVKEENTDENNVAFKNDFAKQVNYQYYKNNFLFSIIPDGEALNSILEKLSIEADHQEIVDAPKKQNKKEIITNDIPANDFAEEQPSTIKEKSPIVKDTTEPVPDETIQINQKETPAKNLVNGHDKQEAPAKNDLSALTDGNDKQEKIDLSHIPVDNKPDEDATIKNSTVGTKFNKLVDEAKKETEKQTENKKENEMLSKNQLSSKIQKLLVDDD